MPTNNKNYPAFNENYKRDEFSPNSPDTVNFNKMLFGVEEMLKAIWTPKQNPNNKCDIVEDLGIFLTTKYNLFHTIDYKPLPVSKLRVPGDGTRTSYYAPNSLRKTVIRVPAFFDQAQVNGEENPRLLILKPGEDGVKPHYLTFDYAKKEYVIGDAVQEPPVPKKPGKWAFFKSHFTNVPEVNDYNNAKKKYDNFKAFCKHGEDLQSEIQSRLNKQNEKKEAEKASKNKETKFKNELKTVKTEKQTENIKANAKANVKANVKTNARDNVRNSTAEEKVKNSSVSRKNIAAAAAEQSEKEVKSAQEEYGSIDEKGSISGYNYFVDNMSEAYPNLKVIGRMAKEARKKLPKTIDEYNTYGSLITGEQQNFNFRDRLAIITTFNLVLTYGRDSDIFNNKADVMTFIRDLENNKVFKDFFGYGNGRNAKINHEVYNDFINTKGLSMSDSLKEIAVSLKNTKFKDAANADIQKEKNRELQYKQIPAPVNS